jgi:hypothetical protein
MEVEAMTSSDRRARRKGFGATLSLALFTALPAGASQFLDYTKLGGAASTGAYVNCGVRHSSSGILAFYEGTTGGMVVVQSGGSSQSIDDGEWVRFQFEPPGTTATEIRVEISVGSDTDGDLLFNEAAVEVVNVGLGIVQTFSVDATTSYDVSALASGAPLESFRITADDSFRLGRIRYRLAEGTQVAYTPYLGATEATRNELRDCGTTMRAFAFPDEALTLLTVDSGVAVASGQEGSDDRAIDADEILEVAFDEPALGVRWRLPNVDGGSDDAYALDFTASGAGEVDLGGALYQGVASSFADIDVSELFDDAPFSAFSLTRAPNSDDAIFLPTLVYTVPESRGGALALVALAALRAWRVGRRPT